MNRHGILPRIAWLGALVFLCISTAGAREAPQFHLASKWVVGGLGRWHEMAFDPVSHLLYVTRQDHVIAVDTNTGRQVSSVGGLDAAYGIALDRSGYGYISDAGLGVVVVFSRRHSRVIRAIPAGQDPDSIVFDRATDTIWAFDVRGNKAVAIDAKSQGAVATLSLPGRPESAASGGGGMVYSSLTVDSGRKSEIARIDAVQRKVAAVWPLADCRPPVRIAVDGVGKRLFAACSDGNLAILSAISGREIARLFIGPNPGDVRFSPADRYVFVAMGSGSLKVIGRSGRIDEGKYSVLETVPTLPGAGTMALSSDGSRVYLAAAQQNIHLHVSSRVTHPRPAVTEGPFVILVIAR